MKAKRCVFSVLLALALMLALPAAGLAESSEGFIPESVHVTDYYVRNENAPRREHDEFSAGEVFGRDDRIVIDNTEDYPFCAVAYMDMHYKCGCAGTGSGFMVERNKLMTAAHCMVCTTHSEWADDITFYFGYKDDRHYSYKYAGRWYAFVGNTFPGREYTTNEDWAVVKFYENIGDTVGWFGFYYNIPNENIINKSMLLLGYRDGILKISEGNVTAGPGSLLQYRIDMLPGNSGGPVFFLEDGIPYVAAINIAESSQTNYGFRITREIYSKYMQLDDY